MYLIIAKESEERTRALEEALKNEKAPPLTFNAENFDAFLQEIETVPFLSNSKCIVLEEVDKLQTESLAQVCSYLERPNPWISLYLTAASMSAQSKLVKKIDHVIRIKDEKPWEKEKRLASWLVEKAASAGVVITLPTAQNFVKNIDSQVLESELEKLICFVGDKREITLEAIRLISTPVHHETLWQLGEAIFERRSALALQIGRRLLEDGMALFPLLAHLRTQFHTTLKILMALQEGGKPAVSAALPYLKGGLLDKKVNVAQSYGFKRLKEGIVHLFESELKAKNSAIDPEILLEILLIKVT